MTFSMAGCEKNNNSTTAITQDENVSTRLDAHETSNTDQEETVEDANILKVQEEFDTYLQESFEEAVTTDTITLHYSLAHPENYGIKMDKITLGEFDLSEEALAEDKRELEEDIKELEGFDYEHLTEDQQLTYDVLYNHLETELLSYDNPYLYEPFAYISGLQTNLPITMSEYAFYDEEGGKEYYEYLLKSVVGTDKTPEEIIKMLESEIAVAEEEEQRIIDGGIEGVIVEIEPMRYLLRNKGYIEGWATYVEFMSFDYYDEYTGESYIDLNTHMNRSALLLFARIDIGVNYEGWSLEEACDYIGSYDLDICGVSADEVYDYVISEPGNYQMYALGMIEIENLKEYTQQQLGEKFDEVEFHKVVLDAGPCQLSILEDIVYEYVNEKK